MPKDIWGDKFTVKSFPQRPCLACGEMYFPDNHWSERCPPCKTIGAPKTKKIVNQHFNGSKSGLLPLEKLRVREYGGVKYPSVTTVLHPFGIPDFPAELMIQYSSRGTLVHKQCEMFLKHNIWLEVEDLIVHKKIDKAERKELKEAWRIVRTGSKGLKVTDCNFRGFYKEHRKHFLYSNIEVEIINKKYKYCGRLDCHGTYKKFNAIIDFKTASDYNQEKLMSYFDQLSAYARSDGMGKIGRLVIIPLNPKSPTGFDKPLVTKRINFHFKRFLRKRKEFKKLYGI